MSNPITPPAWQQRVKGWLHDDQNIKGFFGEYRWLSNFHVSPIFYEGHWYAHAEAAYQAAKTLNKSEKALFLGNITPAEAKKQGRKVTLRPDWEDVKLKIMKDVLQEKFFQDTELRERLENTGEKYLEETNWWNDKYWGVSYGKGENHLGKILMQIRDIIKVA